MEAESGSREAKPLTRWKRGHYVSTVDGTALGGYDPVAYSAQAKPVPGNPEITAEWSGAKWRFATPDHRDRFLASPERYAPRVGGYCAFAVSFSANPKAPAAPPGNPLRWSIVDGKLYLNANRFAHVLFRLFKRAAPAERVWRELSA